MLPVNRRYFSRLLAPYKVEVTAIIGSYEAHTSSALMLAVNIQVTYWARLFKLLNQHCFYQNVDQSVSTLGVPNQWVT